MIHIDGVTLTQEFRRCKGENPDKPCQKCDNGPGHGPYWYARGPFGLKYIGKELPESINIYIANLELDKPTISKLKEQASQREREAFTALEQARDELRTLDSLVNGWQQPDPDALRRLGLERFILDWRKLK